MKGTLKDAQNREYPYVLSTGAIYNLLTIDKINIYELTTKEQWPPDVIIKIMFRSLQAGKSDDSKKWKSMEDCVTWLDEQEIPWTIVYCEVTGGVEADVLEQEIKKNERAMQGLTQEQQDGIMSVMKTINSFGQTLISKNPSPTNVDSIDPNSTSLPPVNSSTV
jgi:hypothetical protein